MKKILKTIFEYLPYVLFFSGAAFTIYISGWLMFLKPIVILLRALETNIITCELTVKTILLCFFSGTVGTMILMITGILMRTVMYISKYKLK